METLRGEVNSIVFCNEDNGFVIARIRAKSQPGLVTIVGIMGKLAPGESLELSGNWKDHPRFGRQFEVQSFLQLLPASTNGIRRYLASGMIKGVGPVMAERMVKKFGVKILEVLDDEPEKLLKIEGLGKKKLDQILSSWEEQREIRSLMLFLQEHDIAPTFASRIFKLYGVSSVQRIRQDPYALAYDIRGIGFKSADSMALKLGFAVDAPQRLEAGLIYTLYQAGENGNLFLPAVELFHNACKILGETSFEGLQTSLNALLEKKKIFIQDLEEQNIEQAVFLSFFYRMEKEICNRLHGVSVHESNLDYKKLRKALEAEEKTAGIKLSTEQKQAVFEACENKVYIITGGPGTGKTTITRMVVRAMSKLGLNVKLAAPTGRAAKRMSEATGKTASTLHRLLGASPGSQFKYNEEKKLKADALIIDEVSMLDCGLALHLLRALPLTCRLVLVGDVNQLPSVGPGNVLHDLLQSQVIPCIYLKHIFRQAQESMIVVNAHRINEGQFPVGSPKPPPQADFFWVENEDVLQVRSLILKMVCERMPLAYGLDPMREVQVLTPMHKGDVGTMCMNELLQQELNPHGQEIRKGQRIFRVGDRVLQTKNNYDKDVFNGDLGWIVHVDPNKNQLKVDFEGREVEYETEDLDELTLAYAVSVHKSQGSEYPAIIMPIVTSHYIMLQRNLIYTGLTRARRLAVLIGSRQALGMGIKNLGKSQRYTHLQYRLQALFNQ